MVIIERHANKTPLHRLLVEFIGRDGTETNYFLIFYMLANITVHNLIPNKQPLSKSNRRWVRLMRLYQKSDKQERIHSLLIKTFGSRIFFIVR